VENAVREARAFHRLGIPPIEVTQDDSAHGGLQYVIGVSPCQIDFLTTLPGIPDFDEAWAERSTGSEGGIPIHFLGRSQLIMAKSNAGRPQDMADIDEIRRADP
jgi:hypothetical protein